jgi:hypothetical protein
MPKLTSVMAAMALPVPWAARITSRTTEGRLPRRSKSSPVRRSGSIW